jgi:hypothetical protein
MENISFGKNRMIWKKQFRGTKVQRRAEAGSEGVVYELVQQKENVIKTMAVTKCTKGGIFLDTLNMLVNFLQMRKRICMRSTRNIRPSSIDIIRY